MMSVLPFWLLQNALIATLAALILLLALRHLAISARAEHLLWAAIAVKFLFPPLAQIPVPPLVHPASAVVQSVAESVPLNDRRNDARESRDDLTATAHGAPLRDSDNRTRPDQTNDARGQSAIVIAAAEAWTVALIVWAAGALFTFLLQIGQLIRWRRRRRLAPAPKELADAVNDVAAALGMTAPHAMLDAALESPVVVGMVRPRLLWPTRLIHFLPSDTGRAMVVHELAHVQRGDLWLGSLVLLGNSIWWWYPGWRLVRNRLHDAAERACDARAMEIFPRSRRAYAEALLGILVGAGAPCPAASSRLRGAGSMRSRLQAILASRERAAERRRRKLALVVLIVAVAPSWSVGHATEVRPHDDVHQIPSISTVPIDATDQPLRDESAGRRSPDDAAPRGTVSSSSGEQDNVNRRHTVPGVNTTTQRSQQFTRDDAVAALLRFIGDPDGGVRRSIANALRDLGGAAATAALRLMITDPDEYVARAARAALHMEPRRPNLDLLLQGDRVVSSPVEVDSLAAMLGADDPAERLRAANALGNLRDVRSGDALIVALGDRDFRVRQAAVSALGNIGHVDAVRHVVRLLDDPHPRVRQSAAGALGAMRAREAVPALRLAVRDEDVHVRQVAASALGRAGDGGAAGTLIIALDDEAAAVRRAAVGALARLAVPEAP